MSGTRIPFSNLGDVGGETPIRREEVAPEIPFASRRFRTRGGIDSAGRSSASIGLP